MYIVVYFLAPIFKFLKVKNKMLTIYKYQAYKKVLLGKICLWIENNNTFYWIFIYFCGRTMKISWFPILLHTFSMPSYCF